MIDPELKAELDAIKATADAAYKSADATRKWIKWTAIVTALLFILPLLAIPFAISGLLATYSSALSF